MFTTLTLFIKTAREAFWALSHNLSEWRNEIILPDENVGVHLSVLSQCALTMQSNVSFWLQLTFLLIFLTAISRKAFITDTRSIGAWNPSLKAALLRTASRLPKCWRAISTTLFNDYSVSGACLSSRNSTRSGAGAPLRPRAQLTVYWSGAIALQWLLHVRAFWSATKWSSYLFSCPFLWTLLPTSFSTTWTPRRPRANDTIAWNTFAVSGWET